MKYTIKNIMPSQIEVTFEDGSWAIVPITPYDSIEEIDHKVSFYDPDFLMQPQTINPNISVGSERFSVRIEPQQQINIGINTNFADEQTTIPFNPPNILVENTVKHPQININAIAEYYADQGDTRLKDTIRHQIENEIITDPNFSVEKLIENIKYSSYSPEDIFNLAEQELLNEQSGTTTSN